MSRIVLALLTALVWCALNGAFTVPVFLWGLAFAALSIWIVESRAVKGIGGNNRRGWKWATKPLISLRFASWFAWEVLTANLQVLKIVLSPRLNIRPAVLAIPLDVQSDAGITLLANLITLTPGTLSIDVSTDRSTLYIHVMHVEDIEGFRRRIKSRFERRVIEVLS